jgi:EmrB/QacA subfamily drug resistance transporter
MSRFAGLSTYLRTNADMPGLALALAVFLNQFDVTAVVVAMPAIGRDLGFGVTGFAWVMDAYSLAFTGTLLASGALADRYGRRRALLVGNILFLAASLACGLAANGPELWAARAAQGVGAAFVITGAIALLASAYPKPEERARAFGLMGVISGVAMALGPTLGGVIAAWFGWRWIFLANIPPCVLIAWAVPRLVDETRDADGRPLDIAGIILLTLALGLTIEALLAGRHAPTHAALGLLAGAVLLGLFVVWQRRQVRPMLDPAVFARRVMVGIAVLLFAVSFGYWAVLVYLPLFLRTSFGWPPELAGLALLAATVPMLVLPPIGGRVVLRWGWRRLFATGLAITAAGDLLLAGSAASPDGATRLGVVLLGMACIGAGAALAHPQLSGAVVALVPPDQAGMASAVTIVARQAGFAIGIAVLGAVLVSDTRAEGFVAPFTLAAVSALAGLCAALLLLPAVMPKAKVPGR